MWVVKYKINEGQWQTNASEHSELDTLKDFCFRAGFSSMEDENRVKTVYALLTTEIVNEHTSFVGEMEHDGERIISIDTKTTFEGFHQNNIPQNINAPTVFGENQIVIQKMTKKELEKFPDHTDIFEWLKQQVQNTQTVPDGFERPIIAKDSVTIVSQAKLTISHSQ